MSLFLNDYGEDVELVGGRTAVDILAPGVQIDMIGPNGDPAPTTERSGTSFAAPHVTGTASLLYGYAYERIDADVWAETAIQHQVIKAVIMNSADKLKDQGDGLLLGMQRTVNKRLNDDDWLDSDAYSDDAIPLDEQMGTGHLNANRALQQFRAGEHDAGGSPVPSIGWDFGRTLDAPDIQTYELAEALPAGQFVSITLAWDRDVLLDLDFGDIDVYDIGDTFLEAVVPADLNLYLVPAGMGIAQAVAKSIATDTSVEHIFAEIETPGMYEIWVEQATSGLFGEQDYALAWWTRALPSTFGDYDGDGTVDTDDYDVWKSAFGTTNPAADGNGDGIVDAADYTVWRDNLGSTLPGSGSIAAVPEPAAGLLMLLGVTAALTRFHPRRLASL